jgi:hypothetical protein
MFGVLGLSLMPAMQHSLQADRMRGRAVKQYEATRDIRNHHRSVQLARVV